METETTPKRVFEVEYTDSKFDEKYAALLAFKGKTGHCNVPSTWKEDTTLANWVCNIRQRYKGNIKVGRLLTNTEIKKLNDAGFEWTRVIRKRTDLRTTDVKKRKERSTVDGEIVLNSSELSSSSILTDEDEEEETISEVPLKKKRVEKCSSSPIELSYIIEEKFGNPDFPPNSEFGIRFKKSLTSNWVIIDASKVCHKMNIPPPSKLELKKDGYTYIKCITDICPVSSITLTSFKYYISGINIRKELIEFVWSDIIKK